MTDKHQCPKCGAELSADAAHGLCPKCLLDAGLESQAAGEAATGPFVTPTQAASPTIPPPSRFPTPYLETLARQFPQLEILEHLGQGGMGVVYKARQRQLDRLVALKILPSTLGQEAAFTERFTREARALAKLNHPNIVHVYDFGRTDEHFYFVMEFVDGVNLRSLIRDGRLKPEEALRIVPQICEALQFAHDEGIVHRDIKPENILIDTRGRVKIADFGLAKLMDQHGTDFRLTGTDQVMGTLNYMAPEQMQGSRTVDHRADIYSLGVVFYEMLTGELPVGRFEVPSKRCGWTCDWITSSCDLWNRNRTAAISTPAKSGPTWSVSPGITKSHRRRRPVSTRRRSNDLRNSKRRRHMPGSVRLRPSASAPWACLFPRSLSDRARQSHRTY